MKEVTAHGAGTPPSFTAENRSEADSDLTFKSFLHRTSTRYQSTCYLSEARDLAVLPCQASSPVALLWSLCWVRIVLRNPLHSKASQSSPLSPPWSVTRESCQRWRPRPGTGRLRSASFPAQLVSRMPFVYVSGVRATAIDFLSYPMACYRVLKSKLHILSKRSCALIVFVRCDYFFQSPFVTQ